MKKFTIIIALSLFAASCGGSESHDEPTPVTPTPSTVNEVTVNTKTKGNLTLSLTTDKACYKPGETVRFSVEGTIPSGAMVRYRQGANIVATTTVSGNTWTWTAPSQDFCGYMADVYVTTGNEETIYGTIAVDVSSDWTRFPRYGFVASYGQNKTTTVISEEMAWLNRCHINGIQFYDWHYKHHWPAPVTNNGTLMDKYTEIANREVVTDVVKQYISTQHNYGMKAMFYNLCFGALSDYAADGAKAEWLMYKQTGHGDIDQLILSNAWKSNILLMNPENTAWQQYLAQRNEEVYKNFDFDGYHIDQVGDRGTVYDYDGNRLNLPRAYASFINAMKSAHPQKRLVMNAVASFGASQIAQTQKTDFLYNELWDSEAQFSDLLTVKKANDSYSSNQCQTVFAAYMNYGKSSSSGTFNTSGVLLADAVMFAIGGSHLELGDGHMLCHEYFPNNNLQMNNELKTAIVSYYDFMTAYEQLLRGNGTETTCDISSSSSSVSLNAWPPQLKKVTVYCKSVDGKTVLHLLNFRQANNLSWRDMDGTMPTPVTLSDLPLTVKQSAKVGKIWVATPDALGGAIQELSFKQDGSNVTFTLPSLKYWTMIVLE